LFLLAGRPKAMPKANRPDPLLQAVIAQCGRARPSLAYLGSASADHPGFFQMIAGLFRNAGAGDVFLAPTAGPTVDLARTQKILKHADVILVSGGDAEEGMRVLAQQRLVSLLRDRFETGTPFIGLSAGSLMLSRQWVRWPDPSDDSTAQTFPCLGFAPVFCDTHGEDDDWEELHALLRLAPPETVGYGIPSGACLCVTPKGQPLALGDPVHRFALRHGNFTRLPGLPPTSQS
jgi:cyanophycinase-like exopeptidase